MKNNIIADPKNIGKPDPLQVFQDKQELKKKVKSGKATTKEKIQNIKNNIKGVLNPDMSNIGKMN